MAHTYVALSNIRAHDDDRIFLFFIFSSRRPFVFFRIYLFIFILFFYYSVCNVRVCRRRAAVVFNTKSAMYVCAPMHTCPRVCACVCTCMSLPTHVYIKRQSLIFSRRTELTVKCTSQTPNVYHPAALARPVAPRAPRARLAARRGRSAQQPLRHHRTRAMMRTTTATTTTTTTRTTTIIQCAPTHAHTRAR